MKSIINDVIITTDSSMFYYGSKKKFESGDWKELYQMVSFDDLDDPHDYEAISTMFSLAKRKKKRMLLDKSFLKVK